MYWSIQLVSCRFETSHPLNLGTGNGMPYARKQPGQKIVEHISLEHEMRLELEEILIIGPFVCRCVSKKVVGQKRQVP